MPPTLDTIGGAGDGPGRSRLRRGDGFRTRRQGLRVGAGKGQAEAQFVLAIRRGGTEAVLSFGGGASSPLRYL